MILKEVFLVRSSLYTVISRVPIIGLNLAEVYLFND